MTWQVRELRDEDRGGWDRVYAAYLDFYGETLPADVLDHVFGRLVDPTDPVMFGLVAVDEHHRVLGLANVVVHPNTWSSQDDAYLEDLAVAPEVRGQGVGHALVEALVDLGRRHGWRRLHWHTEADNARARRLYDDVAELTSYVRYVRDVT